MRERLDRSGSIAVELMALTPVIALFLLLIVQISAAYHQAIGNLADAEADAAKAIIKWEEQNWNRGLSRPCLELIEPQAHQGSGNPVYIGTGIWKAELIPSQVVKIAVEPVCYP